MGQNRGFSSPVLCWESKVRSSFGLLFCCIIFAIADASVRLGFPRFLELFRDENRILGSVTIIITSYNDSGAHLF